MRFYIPCGPCLESRLWNEQALLYNDDNWYQYQCSEGHASATTVLRDPYEILFEVGIQAICDGHFREAVSSFAVALERFYEYAFRVIAATQGTDQAAVDQTWKLVAAQSERQLGLYAAAYLAFTGAAAPTLKESNVKLRNRVVHKGAIPNEATAIDFGEAVLAVIQSVHRTLSERCRVAMDATIHEIEARATNRLPPNVKSMNAATGFTMKDFGLEMPIRKWIEDRAAQGKDRPRKRPF